MTKAEQVAVFLGIPYAVLCLTPWIILVAKMIGTYVRMVNADRPLYREFCSLRSLWRTPEETRTLLARFYERDPRIEALYTATWKWFTRTVFVWTGSFLVMVVFAIMCAGVTLWLGVD